MQVRTTEQQIGIVEPPAVQAAPRTAERGTRRRGTGWIPSWARHPLLWVEAAIGLYVLLVSISAMTTFLDRDEGAFLTVAQVILRGGVPYRDAFDQKSPGIYYLLAGLLAITKWLSPIGQILVIRAVVVLTNFATASGLVLLGRRWWSLEVGVLAAALWLFCMPVFQGDLFFTEPFAVAATVFALVAVAYSPTARGALWAGLLLALGSLFKQTVVLAVPGVALLLLPDWRTTRRWWRPSLALLARLAAFAAGLIVPWLLVGGAFALAGAFGDMWQQVVVSNLTHYPAEGSLRVRLMLGPERLPLIWIAPALLAVVGIARWLGWWPGRRRSPAPSPANVALWIIMLLAALPFATHSYPHYWLQLLPSAVLLTALAALALFEIWREAIGRPPGQTSPQLTGQPAGQTAAAPQSLALRLLAPSIICGLLLFAAFHPPVGLLQTGIKPLIDQAQFGRVIDANTAPSDHIVVMPAQSEYYFLSNRAPATSTIYIQEINLTPSVIANVESDLDAQRYPAVVWQLGAFNDWPQLIAVYQHLGANYHIVAQDKVGGLQLWKPNTAP